MNNIGKTIDRKRILKNRYKKISSQHPSLKNDTIRKMLDDIDNLENNNIHRLIEHYKYFSKKEKEVIKEIEVMNKFNEILIMGEKYSNPRIIIAIKSLNQIKEQKKILLTHIKYVLAMKEFYNMKGR